MIGVGAGDEGKFELARAGEFCAATSDLTLIGDDCVLRECGGNLCEDNAREKHEQRTAHFGNDDVHIVAAF